MIDFRMKNGACELLLVRHADAMPQNDEEADETHIEQTLSPRGRAQAAALAERFAHLDIATIYSSTIRRAAETAQAVAVRKGMGVYLEERFREIDLGNLELELDPAMGAADRTKARLAAFAAIAIGTGSWASIPDTEPSASVRARTNQAVDEIVQRFPGKRILIVSHAGTINAYLASVLNLPLDFFFPAENTAVSVVRAHGDRRLLVSLNDINHLHKLDELGMD